MVTITRKGLRLPVNLRLSTLLSGCVLPEELNADISIKGCRYDVALEGRLAEPRTIGALAKKQVLPADHEEQMKAQPASALKLPGMAQFSYVGEGRYGFAMTVAGELSAAAPVVSFPNTKGGSNNFLTIRREQDGTVLISSPEVPPKDLADLSEVGLGASGKISIRYDGEVLDSNADDQPANGAHVWNRTTWEDRVVLKFDLKGK